MAELNDLSGPFNPGLRFTDFSKEFLVKLIGVWQWAWLQMDAAWFEVVKKRWGDKVAWQCDLEMWLRVAERCNPRYAKLANIPLNNVVDSLKLLRSSTTSRTRTTPSSRSASALPWSGAKGKSRAG